MYYSDNGKAIPLGYRKGESTRSRVYSSSEVQAAISQAECRRQGIVEITFSFLSSSREHNIYKRHVVTLCRYEVFFLWAGACPRDRGGGRHQSAIFALPNLGNDVVRADSLQEVGDGNLPGSPDTAVVLK